MDVQTPTRVGMPMEDFIRQYEQAPFELVDGERIPLPLQVAGHGEIIRLLNVTLTVYSLSNPEYIIYTEMPVVLEDAPNWVKGSRVPDLMIYEKVRWDEYRTNTPDWKSKPFVLVPDLCVEVISANDSYADVDAKVAGYLRDGVRLVWVFNPREKAVIAHTLKRIVRLTEADTLDGADVLPGFSLPLAALFA